MNRAASLFLVWALAAAAWAQDPQRVWMGGTPAEAAAAIAAGADVNARDAYGSRPLLLAAQWNGRIVPVLLKAGADIDGRDESGRTALMVAAAHGTWETIAVLLKAGANLNARDPGGKTAVELAAEFGKDPGVVLRLVGAALGDDARPLDLTRPSTNSLHGTWVGGGYYAIQVLDLFVEDSKVEAGLYVKVRPNMGSTGTLRGYGYEYRRLPVEWDGETLRFRYDVEVENVLLQERGTFHKVPLWFQLRPTRDGNLEGVHVWGDQSPDKVIYRKRSERPGDPK